MRDGILDQRHPNQTLLGRFDCFLNCQRNFAGFACAKPDMPTFIANHDEGRKRHVLTALHDFGHAVDGNNLIF